MKILIILLYAFAVILGAFAYWGLFTAAGRHAYDEMDGLIPAFALLAAILCFLIAVFLSLVLYFKKRKALKEKK